MTTKCLSFVPPALFILLLLPGIVAAAESSERDLRKELKSADDAVRISAIEALSESDEKNKAKLIAGRLKDSSPEVRAAAAGALGRIGGRVAVGKLLRAMKAFSKDPESLAKVCAALGQTGSPAAVDALAKLALKEMSRDATLTKAAVAALGEIRDRRSIEELVGILGSATPVRSARTYSYGHPALMAPTRSALQRLTGLKLYSYSEWSDWWRRTRKRYKFPDDPATQLARQVYRDEGFLFEMTRPDGDRWEFSQPRGLAIQARLRRTGSEASYAAVQIRATSARSSTPSSQSGLADYLEDRFEDEFKDIKDVERQDRDRISGRPAVYHRVVGMLQGGLVVELRQWVVLYQGNLYTIRAISSSGAAEKVKREMEKILKSIRFLPA